MRTTACKRRRGSSQFALCEHMICVILFICVGGRQMQMALGSARFRAGLRNCLIVLFAVALETVSIWAHPEKGTTASMTREAMA
jgi:hypothetical protein